MKNISYSELINCQDYAERVINYYKLCNNGAVPLSATDAEIAVIEYNKEHKPFIKLYGYSIRGYVPVIIESIGFIIEQ